MITSAGIILILGAVAAIGGLCCRTWGAAVTYADRSPTRHTAIGLGTASMVLGVVFLWVMAIVYPILYYGSSAEAAQLEAFYDDTLQAFEYTVDATEAIEITASEPGLADVAYLEQGVATSQRLAELRDKVEWYNAKLQWFEQFNGMWLADGFVADLPGHLKPIHLE